MTSITRTQPMYNLTVAVAHTFFVGDGQWLVHNACHQLGPHDSLSPDSHHIIQDAAARELPGYSYGKAPAMQLKGPSSQVGTEHFYATQAQSGFQGGGTYGAERRAAYYALRKAGIDINEAKAAIRYADQYFMKQLGLSLDSPMRIPGTRWGIK